MKKKMATLFIAAMAATALLGGCGQLKETMGGAKDTEQKGSRKSEETTQSEAAKIAFDEIAYFDYERAADGLPMKEIAYREDGSIVYSKEYEYDAVGNETKSITYDADGNMVHSEDYEYDYEYDAAGNITKATFSYPNSNYISYVNEYNADGKRTKYIHYYPNSNDLYGVTEFNADGITKQTHYRDGSITDLTEYEYDADGNIAKKTTWFLTTGATWEIWYNPDGSKKDEIWHDAE